jgi:hypothetical protein
MTLLTLPLRRAAGERAGPIAKQWEGEVVPRQQRCSGTGKKTHLTSPRWRAGPFLSPAYDAGGEDEKTQPSELTLAISTWLVL